MAVVRNATKWTPPSGTGFVINIANLLFTDNHGNFIITNSNNNLVTNTSYNVPRYATAWTVTGL